MDSPTSSQAPILKIPIPEYPCYDNPDEFISNFCLLLRIVDGVLLKHAMTWLYPPHNITHYYCRFDTSKIPQVLNAHTL